MGHSGGDGGLEERFQEELRCGDPTSPIFSPSHPQALCFGLLGVLFMAISLGFMFANWATGQSHVSGH